MLMAMDATASMDVMVLTASMANMVAMAHTDRTDVTVPMAITATTPTATMVTRKTLPSSDK